MSLGLKYARIMFLLGDPRKSVETAFREAIGVSETLKKWVKGIEHFGYYYVMIGQLDHAELLLNLAMANKEQAKYRPHLAISGLRRIRWLASQAARGHNCNSTS